MHRVAGKIMADFISLRNLRFHAFHGVLPQERKVGNDYRLSLRVEYPLEKAMKSDDVNDTLSYAEVLDIVKYEYSVGVIGTCCLSDRSAPFEGVL